MMTLKDYISAWKRVNEDALYTANLEELNNLPLDNKSKEFLVNVGLPDGAAPFLNFELSERPGTHGVIPLTSIYNFLDDSFTKLIVIGYDGSGNPIVIDTENNGEVLLLNHDDGFKRIFINSTIGKFFESLIIYGKFGTTAVETGADLFSFNDEQFNQLKTDLRSVEVKSLDKNTFWDEELNMLLSNRDYFNKDENK